MIWYSIGIYNDEAAFSMMDVYEGFYVILVLKLKKKKYM